MCVKCGCGYFMIEIQILDWDCSQIDAGIDSPAPHMDTFLE